MPNFVLPPQSLRDRLFDEVLITAWSGIPDPMLVELIAAQPYDAVTLDMQHGGHHEDSVLRSIPMILHQNRHAIVRIPVGRFDLASRVLDFGAEAVIAPMINHVDDAIAFANAMKYPPMGERSWGPTFALPRSGRDSSGFLATANRDTLAIAMIETREAFAALDDILAVPGIDAVFVGPSDFSIAWTRGAHVDPTLEDMVASFGEIASRANALGKHAGIFLTEGSLCKRMSGLGYNLIALGTDHKLIALGAKQLLDLARQ